MNCDNCGKFILVGNFLDYDRLCKECYLQKNPFALQDTSIILLN